LVRTWSKCIMAAMALAMACSCSTPAKVATASGKVAAKTVQTGGKVALRGGQAATQVAGKTAVAGVKTGGAVAKAGVTGAASLAKVPLVTLKDTATGVVRQVPWKEGMKLYAATEMAKFDAARKAFVILRDGGALRIQSDWRRIKRGEPEPVLAPGDVVEFSAMRGGM